MQTIKSMPGLLTTLVYVLVYTLFAAASPPLYSPDDQAQVQSLRLRGTPYFPSYPPSCPICAQNFDSINSCALAAPVLANFSNIIFNPGAFIDIIKCACVDTFQAAYPQCADCFIRTNQTELLNCNTEDLPGILQGMRKVCAVESTLNGNVSAVNNETTPTPSAPAPSATSGALGSPILWGSTVIFIWLLTAYTLEPFF